MTEQAGSDLRRADSLQRGTEKVVSDGEQVSKVARVMLNPDDTDVW
jgi:hypothetical protein